MAPENRRFADALDRYWDAAQRGEGTGRPPELDPASAAIVTRMVEQRESTDTRAAHDRLRPLLVANARKLEESMHQLTISGTKAGAIPAGTDVTRWPARFKPGAFRTGLGSAAAIVMLLIAGAAILFTGPLHDSTRRPALVPAAVAPAATPDTVPEGALLRVTLPADGLPAGAKVMGGLNHQTIAPSMIATWSVEPGRCCPGIRLDYVIAGTYTVSSTMAGRLIHPGDAQPSRIEAGSTVTMQPGDATVFPNESTVTYENAGPEPAEMLFWILFDSSYGTYDTDPIPAGAELLNADIQVSIPTLPAAPATLTLRRVTIEAHGRLPGPASLIQFGLPPSFTAAGTPIPYYSIIHGPGGELINQSDQVVDVYVLTWEPRDLKAELMP